MTTSSLIHAKWKARRDDTLAVGSLVNMHAVATEVLADLEALAHDGSDVVTLQEAHFLGGYSTDHLQRLVRHDRIANVGRPGSPRIRRGDIPKKPGYLPPASEESHLSPRRRMALAVTTSKAAGGE